MQLKKTKISSFGWFLKAFINVHWESCKNDWQSNKAPGRELSLCENPHINFLNPYKSKKYNGEWPRERNWMRYIEALKSTYSNVSEWRKGDEMKEGHSSHFYKGSSTHLQPVYRCALQVSFVLSALMLSAFIDSCWVSTVIDFSDAVVMMTKHFHLLSEKPHMLHMLITGDQVWCDKLW